VTVTAAELGTAPGAVYRPELEIVPIVALPPVIAFTCQVTVVLLVFSTVAVNCCVPPTATVADAGEIITVTATGVCVVERPPQLKISNALNPAAASHTEDANRPIALEDFIESRGVAAKVDLVPYLLVLYWNVPLTRLKDN